MQQLTVFTVLPNGSLQITLTEDGMEALEELQQNAEFSDLDIFFRLVEYNLCNGYSSVPPELIGALTDSVIIADGIIDEETTEEDFNSIKTWWYPEYAVCSYIEPLKTKEGLIFTKAEKLIKTPKPYFAKFLPVEGEIKPGDWFHVSGPHEGFYQNTSAITVVELDGYIMEKVKLFLCSNELRLGKAYDAGWCEVVKIFDSVANVEYPDCKLSRPKEALLSVIGEISPKATWVKEGDEFEESEINITHLFRPKINKRWVEIDYEYFAESFEPADDEVFLHITMHNGEAGVQPMLRSDLFHRIEVQIKCPTCGAYH